MNESAVLAAHGKKRSREQDRVPMNVDDDEREAETRQADTMDEAENTQRMARKANLAKAREAKAQRKKNDQEAIARGEMPLSYLGKINTPFPAIMNEDEHVQAFDVKKALWDVDVNIKLPQLMYHSPWILEETLRSFGVDPSHVKRVSTGKDKEPVHVTDAQSTSSKVNIQGLQAVHMKIGNILMEALIDGGALCSIMPLALVEKLNLEDELGPTRSVIKFGGGSIEVPVGTIEVDLEFASDKSIRHRFQVVSNPHTPLLLGHDFLWESRVSINPYEETLTFHATQDSQEVVIKTHRAGLHQLADLNDQQNRPSIAAVHANYIEPRVSKGNVAQVAIESDIVLNPGEVMITHLKVKNVPEDNRGEYLVLETKPAERHEVMLWPSRIYSDGTASLCIANRENRRVGVRAGDIIGVAKRMAKTPESEEDVNQVVEDLKKLVYYPDMPIPRSDQVPVFQSSALWDVSNVHMSLEENDIDQVDICNELTHDQKESLRSVLREYSSRFASRLADVGALKARPYTMELKPGAKPVKRPPLPLPREAEEWLKGYLTQLSDLGFIEKCNGPWAAGALLIPSDPSKREPKSKFKARPLEKEPRLRVSRVGDTRPVWALITNADESTKEDEHDKWSSEDEEKQLYDPLTIQQGVDVNSKEEVYDCTAPPLQAGVKDPYRLVFNYKPINAATVDSGYPIPNIHELFTRLGGAKYFTIMDALKGFWQLPLAEESRDLTGFVVNCGGYAQWRWCRLAMGLKGSPGVWQSVMDETFKEAINQYVMIYIDDLIVFSKTFDEHEMHLRSILRMAAEVNLSFSLKKCKIGYPQLRILGYMVGKDGFDKVDAKVTQIEKWPVPKDVQELSRFIGSLQYYRRFLPIFSTVVEPLNRLRRKDQDFIWDDEQAEAFDKCKELMAEDITLKHPDFTKTFYLFTDASSVGIGGVLTQKSEEGSGIYLPVYFGSKSLTPAERRYSTYEREFYAVVYFVHFFRLYLLGQQFHVICDHKALSFLMDIKENTSLRVGRWLITLSMYDFVIRYIPGKLNVLADAMSRLPADAVDGIDAEEVIIDEYLPLYMMEEEDGRSRKRLKTTSDWGGMWPRRYAALKLYLTRLQYLPDATEEERRVIRSISKDYVVHDEIGDLMNTRSTKHFPRIIVEEGKVLPILQQHHDHMLAGHTGVKSTFNKISNHYWWPKMFEDVRRYVMSCEVCQHFGPKASSSRIHPWPPAQDGIFSKIMIDFFSMPRSLYGCDSVIIGIDTFSGWIDTMSMAGKTAAGTAYFIYKWVCNHGVPKEIISDNGMHFTSKELGKILKYAYGLSIKTGPSWRPQRQGQIERSIGSVRRIMERLAYQYPGTWETWLEAACFVLRTSINRRHGYTPFYLAYGRQPRMPSALDEAWYDGYTDGDNEDIGDDLLLEQLEALTKLHGEELPEAKRKLTIYRLQMMNKFKDVKTESYRVGDKVMLYDIMTSGRGVTLEPRWYGPYFIHKKYPGDVYQLRDCELVLPNTYHVTRLKLYRPRRPNYLQAREDVKDAKM